MRKLNLRQIVAISMMTCSILLNAQTTHLVTSADNTPDTWKYSTALTADWEKTNFDDSSWTEAQAAFGSYGGATTSLPTTGATYYLRNKFNLSSIPVGTMFLNVKHDDGVTFYLNGTQIYANSSWNSDYLKVELSEAQKQLLVTGDNTLAVKWINKNNGLFFDAGLYVEPTLYNNKTESFDAESDTLLDTATGTLINGFYYKGYISSINENRDGDTPSGDTYQSQIKNKAVTLALEDTALNNNGSVTWSNGNPSQAVTSLTIFLGDNQANEPNLNISNIAFDLKRLGSTGYARYNVQYSSDNGTSWATAGGEADLYENSPISVSRDVSATGVDFVRINLWRNGGNDPGELTVDNFSIDTIKPVIVVHTDFENEAVDSIVEVAGTEIDGATYYGYQANGSEKTKINNTITGNNVSGNYIELPLEDGTKGASGPGFDANGEPANATTNIKIPLNGAFVKYVKFDLKDELDAWWRAALQYSTDNGTTWLTLTNPGVIEDGYWNCDLKTALDGVDFIRLLVWRNGDSDPGMIALDNISISSVDPVKNLTISNLTASSCNFSWDAVPGATNYDVNLEREQLVDINVAPGKEVVEYVTVDGYPQSVNGTQLAISNLDDARKYRFSVRTVVSGGKSPYSSTTAKTYYQTSFTAEQLAFPSKKGACFTMRTPEDRVGGSYVENMPIVKALNTSWYYSWGGELPPNTPQNQEFVPMSWGYWGSTDNLRNDFETYTLPKISSGEFKRYLAFNEPDKHEQSNMSYTRVLELWPAFEEKLSSIPVCSPACANALGVDDDSVQGVSGTWMRDFTNAADLRDYHFDYVGVHSYGGLSVSAFQNRLRATYEKYGRRPLVISEFATANWNCNSIFDNGNDPAEILHFMKQVLPWLEQQDWIASYAWFSFGINDRMGSSALVDIEGNLTACGRYYASLTSENPSGDQSIVADEPVGHQASTFSPVDGQSYGVYNGKETYNYCLTKLTTSGAFNRNEIDYSFTNTADADNLLPLWTDNLKHKLTVESGKAFDLTITMHSSANHAGKVWIDWNGDKDFEDAGEEVALLGLYHTVNDDSATYTINVPADAKIGKTRMRVRVGDGTKTTAVQMHPYHYRGTWAQAEGSGTDFTVEIIDPNFKVISATFGGNKCTIKWDEPSISADFKQYNVEILNDANQVIISTIVADFNTTEISLLSDGSDAKVRVNAEYNSGTVFSTEQPTNLLLNGSFESSKVSGWGSWYTSFTSKDSHPENIYNGNFTGVLRAEHSGRYNGEGAFQQEVTLKPDTEYRISVWAKISQIGIPLSLRVKGYDGTTTPLTKSVDSTDFALYTMDFTTSADPLATTVSLYKSSGAAAYLDNFRLVESSSLTPALGIEVEQYAHKLLWTVEEEIGVKEYLVIDAEGNIVAKVPADNSGKYSVILDSNDPVSLVVVDNSGYKQTFKPEDGNEQITTYDLQEGWNLIAVTSEDANLQPLKDATAGVIWGWNGAAYGLIDSAEPTEAVWVYSSTTKQVDVIGRKSDAKISLSAGWNMVGPVENDYIPEDAISVFSWSDTYNTIAGEDKVLIEGVGYWIFAL